MIELAFRVPGRLKIRDGETKWILKQVAERHVPRAGRLSTEGRLQRAAQAVDLRAYREPDGRVCSPNPGSARTACFEWLEVARLKQEHLSGRRNHSHQLWPS